MRIVFATWFGFLNNMHDAGAKDLLLSYYELREEGPEVIPHLVDTGRYLNASKKKTVGWNKSVYVRRRKVALNRRLREYEKMPPDALGMID